MPDGLAKFIVIEGIDGAGTTTQARLLVKRLYEDGHPAVFTSEPTSGPVGGLIRNVLGGRVVSRTGAGGCKPLGADTMSLLFSADRLDHVQNMIEPALRDGNFVVGDRYFYSTLAYQGVDGDMQWIEQASAKARRPDLLVFLHVPVRVAMRRMKRRREREIYEKRDFLEKVSGNYKAILAKEPLAATIDGTKPVEFVSDEIMRLVTERFLK